MQNGGSGRGRRGASIFVHWRIISAKPVC
jgi:hypothetical protein